MLALLVLLGLVGAAAGLLIWFGYHLRVARQAVAQGHNLSAIAHLRSCWTLSPNHPEVLLLSARSARRSGGWSEAEDLLDRYWQLRGDDEALVLERLLLRATRGELEAVRSTLRGRINAGGPEAELAREALAAGLLYRFRLEEAATLIEEWRKADPDSTFGMLAKAKLDELREQTSAALTLYRQVLEADPQHDDARLRMSAVLLQLSQGEEALSHLEYLRARYPAHADVPVRLAQALDLLGRTAEARELLDECIRRDPDLPDALAERGRIAHRDRDGAKAEECLRKAVALDPGNAAARYQLFLALTRNGKPEEAVKEQEAIRQIEADVKRIRDLIFVQIQLTPDDPNVHHEIAVIALRAGRPKEGLRWLQSALQVDPNHTATHSTLSSLYHNLGNPILAARHRALAKRFGVQK